jgi:hypothetical protein
MEDSASTCDPNDPLSKMDPAEPKTQIDTGGISKVASGLSPTGEYSSQSFAPK